MKLLKELRIVRGKEADLRHKAFDAERQLAKAQNADINNQLAAKGCPTHAQEDSDG